MYVCVSETERERERMKEYGYTDHTNLTKMAVCKQPLPHGLELTQLCQKPTSIPESPLHNERQTERRREQRRRRSRRRKRAREGEKCVNER